MTTEYARTEWDRALEALTAAALLVAHGGFDSAGHRALSDLYLVEGRA